MNSVRRDYRASRSPAWKTGLRNSKSVVPTQWDSTKYGTNTISSKSHDSHAWSCPRISAGVWKQPVSDAMVRSEEEYFPGNLKLLEIARSLTNDIAA
ncbi:hypothetical protein TWF730_006740 [Orbilia blumenaviensis]|uniref:Uncharacterized protein n=1 Tax=Orbilia blumenaviensis TaxID=1796055 RepID=A0AAV9VGL3_9PEZI